MAHDQDQTVPVVEQDESVGNGSDGLDGWIKQPFDVAVLLKQVGRLAARRGSMVEALTAADRMG